MGTMASARPGCYQNVQTVLKISSKMAFPTHREADLSPSTTWMFRSQFTLSMANSSRTSVLWLERMRTSQAARTRVAQQPAAAADHRPAHRRNQTLLSELAWMLWAFSLWSEQLCLCYRWAKI